MNTLDQKIVIPVAPFHVWEIISDIARNPSWQLDCENVTFLTTARRGTGVRWRSTLPARGRDAVMELTAWYDRLGYEYLYIDGAPLPDAKGRLRLQEVAEGTIVQWTVNYGSAGLVGGLVNSLTNNRGLPRLMEESLKKLYTQLKATSGRSAYFESKSLLRDAPDVESRQQYKPRHTPAVPPTAEAGVPASAAAPAISEPPVTEEDTRPRPAVVETVESTAVQEPDFLSAVPQQLNTEEMRRFAPPSSTTTAIPDPAPVEVASVTPESVVPPAVLEVASVESETSPASITDTGAVSIFDVFGVPRPSTTQEAPRVVITPAAFRFGLRFLTRRKILGKRPLSSTE